MGSITLTIVGDATVLTKTKAYVVSDADVNRFVAWAKVNYASAAVPSPTTTQALVAWADSTIAALKSAVVSSEKQVTIAAVADPVWTAA